MNNKYESVRKFLLYPNNIDDLWESNDLIWIDWREEDESVINYFNSEIGNLIEVDFINNNKKYGDDIKLKYRAKEIVVPYMDNMDRDTTIKYFNEIIKEDFEIRWFVESLGDDTLAFYILPNNLWSSLENEFSKEVVDYYFMTINLESVMFDLDVDSVFDLISLRKDNNKEPFVELLKKLK